MKSDENTVMPNYKDWADNIIRIAAETGDGPYLIAEALRQCFDQGYTLGMRRGYEDGKNNGWWKSMEADRRNA